MISPTSTQDDGPPSQQDALEFELTSGLEVGRKLKIKPLLKGGRYQIIDVLADGGMGVVYRARDLRVGGNIVLIKAVKYDTAMFGLSREKALYHIYAMRQRFKREKNTLLEMSSRGLNNVPCLNDFFTDDNPDLQHTFPFGELKNAETLQIGKQTLTLHINKEPFIVMERIFGASLQNIISDISERRLLEIARAICRTLEQIHKIRERPRRKPLSFMFMDLKPDNILVDNQGGVVLIDFGAAIPVIGGSRKGKGAFTPGFAPPEIRRFAHPAAIVDHRVDLYSLGAILFQGLSNKNINPIILASELDDEYPILDPGSLRSDITTSTRALTLKALSRQPEGRFDDAEKMRRAIEVALRGVST